MATSATVLTIINILEILSCFNYKNQIFIVLMAFFPRKYIELKKDNTSLIHIFSLFTID